MSATGSKVGISVYLFQSSVSGGGQSFSFASVGWYNWLSLILLLLGSVWVLLSSMVLHNGRDFLLLGAVLSLVALVAFPLGLQSSFPASLGGVGLFGSGSFSYGSYSMRFSSYLTFGFWLCFAAVFLAFLAWNRYDVEEPEEEEPEEQEPYYRQPPPPYGRRPVRKNYPTGRQSKI